MGREVGIKISEFDANISKTKSSAGKINNNMTITDDLERTNIKPFTTDLKKVIKAKELLDKYQELIAKDIEILDETGQEMVENDEQLASLPTPLEIK